MKISIAFVLLLGFTFSLNSQELIQTQAQEFATAFAKSEFLKVAELTHPNVIEKSGGQDYVLEDLKAERTSSSAQGLVYVEAEVEEPLKILKHGDEIQALVPVNYILQLADKEYKNQSYLLAVSRDEGISYSFVNLQQYDDESLKFFIDNLSPDISIPASSEYVEIEK